MYTICRYDSEADEIPFTLEVALGEPRNRHSAVAVGYYKDICLSNISTGQSIVRSDNIKAAKRYLAKLKWQTQRSVIVYCEVLRSYSW